MKPNPKNKYVKPHWKKKKKNCYSKTPAYEIVKLSRKKHKTRRVNLSKKKMNSVRIRALKA